jgi:hypothetical protein
MKNTTSEKGSSHKTVKTWLKAVAFLIQALGAEDRSAIVC